MRHELIYTIYHPKFDEFSMIIQTGHPKGFLTFRKPFHHLSSLQGGHPAESEMQDWGRQHS
jgi:hypothetical protein